MRLLDFLVCDDIRHEYGNKITLVGLYNEVIELQGSGGADIQWPLMFRLGVYVRLLPEARDLEINNFELDFLFEGKMHSKAQGQVIIKEAGRSLLITLIANPFPVPQPGLLTFVLRFKNKETMICEIRPDLPVRISQNKTLN